MLYNTLSVFIDPETKVKINLTGESSDPNLLDLFHPCQLERRFGGTAETPKNFWPPYIGTEGFLPEG